MILSEFNESHNGMFDFFYLPIDPKVSYSKHRTNVTMDMHSSMSYILLLFFHSFKSLKVRNGDTSTARRYVVFLLVDYKGFMLWLLNFKAQVC